MLVLRFLALTSSGVRSPLARATAASEPGPWTADATVGRRGPVLLLGDARTVRRQLHQAERAHEHGQRHGKCHVSHEVQGRWQCVTGSCEGW